MGRLTFLASLLLMTCAASQASEFFGQPQQLCRSLRSEGLATEGWKKSRAMPNEWFCMTTLVPFGAVGSNGMTNNIAFYVNGTSPNRADDVRIKININNPSQKSNAFNRLSSATDALFAAIGGGVPAELSKALDSQQPTAFGTDFGRVELILEPGRIDSYKVVLTDARFIAKKDGLRSASASDFDKCKEVVAKKVGYAASSLSGDGDPVQESGYKSFMLKGMNRDLFFCEVHSGGRYKIKAALRGNFPFRYIDEGTF